MKKCLAVLLFLLPPLALEAFDNSHYLSLSWGSYNLDYFYPASEVGYVSPRLFGLNAAVNVNLRSVGTLLVYTKGAYDLLLTGEYEFTLPAQGWSVRAGAGMELWLDAAYKTFTSVRPVLTGSLCYGAYVLRFEAPLSLRFYNDGFVADLRVQGYYRMFSKMSVTMWIELAAYTYYDFHYTLLRPGTFVGLETTFGK